MKDLLSGRKITAQELILIDIDRIELLNGEIICGDKMAFLKILIENVGLLPTLQLFPRKNWEKALKQLSRA